MSMKSNEIYEAVTQKIVASLEEGHIPWHRPWSVEGGLHRSLSTKKPYRGINQFILGLTAQAKGYESSWWGTYKQIEKLGGQVRKGEKSEIVVFFKPLPIEEKNKKTGKTEKRVIFFLKYFRVFNADQVDGELKIPVLAADDYTVEERVATVIDGAVEHMELAFVKSEKPFYDAAADEAHIDISKARPEETFKVLVHATAHSSRLNRVPDADGAYGKEELIGAMGASMLAGLTGLDYRSTKKATERVCQNWIEKFQENPRLVVQAASKAQGAADYVVGPEEEDDDE